MEITSPIIHGVRQNAAHHWLLRLKGMQTACCFGQTLFEPQFRTARRFVNGLIN